MKLPFQNNAKTFAVLAIICLGFLMQRCSKEKEELPFTGDGTKLIVNVIGINEKTPEGTGNLKASTTAKQAAKNTGVLFRKLQKHKGFDALVSVKRNERSSGLMMKAPLVTGAQNFLVAEAVEIGVKYRLLIYTQDGTFVSSNQLTSGTAAEIDIAKGTDYYWYALSYNTSDNIPDIDPNNPVLNLPGDKDVLYASGEILLPADQNTDVPLSIVFKHSFARIGIELNSMGMFADMVSANVTVSGAPTQTGTIDLRTGVISDLTNSSSTINFASFTDVEPPYADNKRIYIYTASEAPLTELTVTVSGLEIKIDDGSIRSFTDASSDFIFEINPLRGSTHTAQINLVESTLDFQNRKWARQNLYYHGGHNPYRFHHTYRHRNDRNTYFSFKGLIPGQYGENIENDPCALVYPQGLWKTAGFNEYAFLTPQFPEPIYGFENGLRYIEYDVTTGTEAPYPGNNLRFYQNGSGTAIGVVHGVIEIDLGDTYGRTAELWTSTPEYGETITSLTGAYYYSAGIGDNVDKAVIDVSMLGSQDIETDFKNVRCVRDGAYLFP